MKILILSDIHANVNALDSVMNHATSYDYLIFVGDSVDYGPNPRETVDWLKDNADIIVMGNHDNAVAWKVDCKCGEKTHELSVYTRENISLKLLDEDQVKYLRILPKKKIITVDSLKLYIVHGSPRNPLYDYIYPDLSEEAIKRALVEKTMVGTSKPINADFVILGHTHIPMIRRINNVSVINPGSVGQPRDNDNRASYGVLDTESRTFNIQRVKYPIDKTIANLKKLGLDAKYEKWIVNLLITANVDEARERVFSSSES